MEDPGTRVTFLGDRSQAILENIRRLLLYWRVLFPSGELVRDLAMVKFLGLSCVELCNPLYPKVTEPIFFGLLAVVPPKLLKIRRSSIDLSSGCEAGQKSKIFKTVRRQALHSLEGFF